MANKPSEKFLFSPEKAPLPRIEESKAESAPSSLFTEEQLPQPADTTTPSAVNKPKVSRTQFSIFQKVALEYSFHTCLYLTGEERDALASKLGLSPVIVQTWFKNRRFKWRREIKMAEGTQPEPAIPAAPPALLYPSPPPLSFWQSYPAPEPQQPDGSFPGRVYSGCCGGNPPRAVYNSKTQW